MFVVAMDSEDAKALNASPSSTLKVLNNKFWVFVYLETNLFLFVWLVFLVCAKVPEHSRLLVANWHDDRETRVRSSFQG